MDAAPAYRRGVFLHSCVANQKHGVVSYCIDKKLLQLVCVEDTICGKTDRRGRQLGKMIRGAGQDVG